MTNAALLEDMLTTIARLEVKDEASIRAAFPDPKAVEVSIGAKGIGLTLGKTLATYVTDSGHVSTGPLNFGSIAPVASTFVLGEVAEAPKNADLPPPIAPPATSLVREIEGTLPRRKREGNGAADPVPPVIPADPTAQ